LSSVGLTRPATFIGSGFLVAYLLMPTRLFDSAYSEVRLNSLDHDDPSRVLDCELAVAVRSIVAEAVDVTVILINAASVTFVWLDYRSDYAEIIESFRLLPPGSTILIARSDASGGGKDAPMYYAPTLAAHYATAFVPASLRAIRPVKRATSKSRFEI
jgi:hypothetical protein